MVMVGDSRPASGAAKREGGGENWSAEIVGKSRWSTGGPQEPFAYWSKDMARRWCSPGRLVMWRTRVSEGWGLKVRPREAVRPRPMEAESRRFWERKRMDQRVTWLSKEATR